MARGCLIGAGHFAQNHARAWGDLAAQGARVDGGLGPSRTQATAALLGACASTRP